MLEHEVRVYDIMSQNMKRVLNTMWAIMRSKPSNFKYWTSFSVLMAFAIAQAYDYLDIQDDEDSFLKVWGRRAYVFYDQPTLENFLTLEITRKFSEENLGIRLSTLSMPDNGSGIVDGENYNVIKDLMSVLYSESTCMVVPVLLHASYVRNLAIQNRANMIYPYYSREMHEDIQRLLVDRSSLISLVGADYFEDFERQCNNLKSLLYKDGRIVIFGRDPELQEAIMSYPRKKSGSSMADTINKISVENQSKDAPEPDYYEMAREYLKGVDYIQDEDEIEGILDSHFISRDPVDAYRTITQTFKSGGVS